MERMGSLFHFLLPQSLAHLTDIVSQALRTPRMLSRALNIHEWQGKELLQKYGCTVQKFGVVKEASQASEVASRLKADELVVKAQVHAGGRGKGTFSNGFKGVHLCKTAQEAEELCNSMLGHNLVTKQTPPGGVRVSAVMIAEAIDIKKEAYFSILLDRAHMGPVMVASPDGGMDIEAVAENTPERIFTVPVDIIKGPTVAQTEQLAKDIGFSGPQAVDAANQMRKLYDAFVDTDATQIEINPLALTETGKVYVADAKLNFDDNAAHRQKEVWNYADNTEEDPREIEAQKANLNYVGMDGNIGCMVNGAGLAMATMDIISLYGAKPANFLDAGGGASAEQITKAFRIITSDPAVEGVLVNIFGGIVRCDTIATGIIEAAKTLNLTVPLVVRLEGTNKAEGYELLGKSGINLIVADNLDDAAQKAVNAIKK